MYVPASVPNFSPRVAALAIIKTAGSWGMYRVRQSHSEGRTAADNRVDGQSTVHQFGKRTGQRQPDARTFHRARLGSKPVEWSEHPIMHFNGNARAVVIDRDRDLILENLTLHPDSSTRLVVFHRIGEEIEQNLPQSMPIRQSDAAGRAEGLHQRDGRGRSQRRHYLHRLVYEGTQGNWLHTRKVSPASIRGNIEVVVNQVQKATTTSEDLSDCLDSRILAELDLKKLSKSEDRIEGRSQLMAHPEEFRSFLASLEAHAVVCVSYNAPHVLNTVTNVLEGDGHPFGSSQLVQNRRRCRPDPPDLTVRRQNSILGLGPLTAHYCRPVLRFDSGLVVDVHQPVHFGEELRLVQSEERGAVWTYVQVGGRMELIKDEYRLSAFNDLTQPRLALANICAIGTGRRQQGISEAFSGLSKRTSHAATPHRSG